MSYNLKKEEIMREVCGEEALREWAVSDLQPDGKYQPIYSGSVGLCYTSQFSDPKVLTLTNNKGIVLLKKIDNEDLSYFIDFIIHEGKFGEAIGRGKDYDEKQREAVDRVHGMLIERIIEEPGIIEEIPVTIPASFKDFDKMIAMHYRIKVVDKLEISPTGEDLSEFYNKVKKNVELFEIVFEDWKKQIDKTKEDKNAILDLLNRFEEEKEAE